MSTNKLDPKNFCGGKVPEFGDGYSDFRSDYDPIAKKRNENHTKELLSSAPDYIKQAIAEHQQATSSTKAADK